MNRYKIMGTVLLTALLAFFYTAIPAHADEPANTYEDTKTFELEQGQGSWSSTFSINSTYSGDWDMTIDKINDVDADNMLDMKASAKSEVGDTVTATILSPNSQAYLGTTIMYKKNGKWKQGSSFTIITDAEDKRQAQTSYTIEEGVTEIKITVCEHTGALAAKRPGCVDIDFTVYVGQKQPFVDTVTPVSDTGTGKGVIKIVILLGVVLWIYRITKSIVEKKRSNKDGSM